MVKRLVLVAAILTACKEEPAVPPAPPGARQAPRGLPPGGQAPAPAPAAGAPPAAAGGEISGEIEVSPSLAAEVKSGDVLYVVARRVAASGEVMRAPVAVDRLVVARLPMAFKMGAAQVMVPGTPFGGKLQITVRLDRDGDAMSRKPGDLEGQTRVEVPAEGVKIVLDTKVASE